MSRTPALRFKCPECGSAPRLGSEQRAGRLPVRCKCGARLRLTLVVERRPAAAAAAAPVPADRRWWDR